MNVALLRFCRRCLMFVAVVRILSCCRGEKTQLPSSLLLFLTDFRSVGTSRRRAWIATVDSRMVTTRSARIVAAAFFFDTSSSDCRRRTSSPCVAICRLGELSRWASHYG